MSQNKPEIVYEKMDFFANANWNMVRCQPDALSYIFGLTCGGNTLYNEQNKKGNCGCHPCKQKIVVQAKNCSFGRFSRILTMKKRVFFARFDEKTSIKQQKFQSLEDVKKRWNPDCHLPDNHFSMRNALFPTHVGLNRQ